MNKTFLTFLLLIVGAVGVCAQTAVVQSSPAPALTAAATDNKKADAKTTKTAAANIKKDDPSSPSPARPVISLPPEKANPVKIPKLDKPPVIDGKLDDEVWKQAVTLKDFYQTSPGDNIEPSRKTEVMIAYDPKFLYFAFHCYDEPDKVRASVAKRDNVFGEDNVRIWLDTFNDQRRAYVLGFNPFGIQQDAISTAGQGEDYNFDIVMESKGVMTTDGWTVEVAIPFKSLRYTA
ncbi:MAG: carbohydrate binding family 9 domain-containing protein, partial [Acidobacteria bacterium]|nr:carbohydrate binding family 9 domain-containing protein [Acidobacteriota bacterium]